MNISPLDLSFPSPLASKLISYKLSDLLDENKRKEAMVFLRQNPPSKLELDQFLKERIKEKDINIICQLFDKQFDPNTSSLSNEISFDYIKKMIEDELTLNDQDKVSLVNSLAVYILFQYPVANPKPETTIYFKYIEKQAKESPSTFSSMNLKKMFNNTYPFFYSINKIYLIDKNIPYLLEAFKEATFDFENSRDLFNNFEKYKILGLCIEEILKNNQKINIEKFILGNFIESNFISKLSTTFKESLLEEFKKLCRRQDTDVKVIESFLKGGITCAQDDIYQITLKGNYLLVQVLLDQGVDISPAIFQLIKSKKEKALTQLLEGGKEKELDPNLRNSEGKTLLIAAIEQNNVSMVRQLLLYGANPLIQDSLKRNVFELSKEKDSFIRYMLYHPEEVRCINSLSLGWNNNPSSQEKALIKFLNTKAKDQSVSKFYGLFIKVNDTVIALLKKDKFANKMRKSLEESSVKHPVHMIHVWASDEASYSISQELLDGARHANMHTLAFTILKQKDSSELDEFVKVDKEYYAINPLVSSYKANNSAITYGFKYDYNNIKTHGHGENPEAALAAFKEHKDKIKISHWLSFPDLSMHREIIKSSYDIIEKGVIESKESALKIEDLSSQISRFITSSEDIINARYHKRSSEGDRYKENQAVQKEYDAVLSQFKKIPSMVLTESIFKDWQSVIHHQIASLKQLEQQLQDARPIAMTLLKNEQESVKTSLNHIKNQITERTNTSSEVPTLKIYTMVSIIEDIRVFSNDSIISLKKAIAKLIGLTLQQMPVMIQNNDILIKCFLRNDFREKVLVQLNAESQLIIRNCPGIYPDQIKELAAYLATFKDLSLTLQMLPPTDRFESLQSKSIADQVLNQCLSAYQKAREILDQFWAQFCCFPKVVDNHLDEMATLLITRTLMMDEENRTQEKDKFSYPSGALHSVKFYFDQQLFLLSLALLMNVSQDPTSLHLDQVLEVIIEWVELRLKDAFYGLEKKPYNFDDLLFSDLIEATDEIKKSVKEYLELYPLIFKNLNQVLNQASPIKKETLVNLFKKDLNQLRPEYPQLKLSNEIKKLLNSSMQIRTEIIALIKEQCVKGLRLVDLQVIIERLLKSSQLVLNLGEEQESPIKKLRAILDKSNLSPSEKDQILPYIQNSPEKSIKNDLDEIIKELEPYTEFEKIEPKNAKSLKKKISELLSSIDNYLKSKETLNPLNFAPYQQNIKNKLAEIDKVSNQVFSANMNSYSVILEKLEKAPSLENEMITEFNKIFNEIQIFLKEEKSAELAKKHSKKIEELQEIFHPLLERSLMIELQQIYDDFTNMQTTFLQSYLSELEQKGEKLSLGIREQIYYTQDNQNLSFFVWDRKPFKDVPYDTYDTVHIPLVQDERWDQSQRSRAIRNLLRE